MQEKFRQKIIFFLSCDFQKYLALSLTRLASFNKSRSVEVNRVTRTSPGNFSIITKGKTVMDTGDGYYRLLGITDVCITTVSDITLV